MYFYIPWGILAYVKISPRFIGLQLVAPPPLPHPYSAVFIIIIIIIIIIIMLHVLRNGEWHWQWQKAATLYKQENDKYSH